MSDERYFPLRKLTKMAGISQADFKKIIGFDNSVSSTEKGVPLFRLIEVLNRAFQTSVGTNRLSGEEGYELATEMQHEKVMKERIANQVKLGMFMDKDEASSRTIKYALLLNNLVKYAVLNTANYLVQQGKYENVRECEIFLTNIWNDALNFVEKNSVVLDWEEDGKTKLVRTRLKKLETIEESLNESSNLEREEDEI